MMTRIKLLLTKFVSWLKLKRADLGGSLQVGIEVANRIKMYVNNPYTDVITALIPSEIDDELVKWLRIWLPKIISKLEMTDDLLHLTDEQQLKMMIAKIQSYPKMKAGYLYGDIAANVNMKVTENPDLNVVYLLTKAEYDEIAI